MCSRLFTRTVRKHVVVANGYMLSGIVIAILQNGPGRGAELKSPEGDRVALGFVHDGFLFASAFLEIKENDYWDCVKSGELTVEKMYDNIGLLINKASLINVSGSKS